MNLNGKIPVTITQEAEQHIAEIGMQRPFQRLLDNIPLRIPNVHAIAVSLQEPYDLGGGLRVIFDVTRDHPGVPYDRTEWNWQSWVVENFPPEEFEHFCLLSIYSFPNASAQVS